MHKKIRSYERDKSGEIRHIDIGVEEVADNSWFYMQSKSYMKW